MIKRLAHRNANVQLYTLEVCTTLFQLWVGMWCMGSLTKLLQLGNSLSQNCGPKIHRELASRSFTDALLRLAADRVRGADPFHNTVVADDLLEHTSTSQVEDIGADAGLDRDVLFKPGFWHYGASLHEVEDSKSVPCPLHVFRLSY